ncbi:endopeptidase [Affinibrenneria salicis]|uniref:Endopeptidase n=1 Tax=Affinibrenneria salicis TaxID=2590031 RepID=A0A5J5G4S4_9GAMM|nr:C40 family peptidase [Affinibrenneria salicis]KAA9002049.1 endopeptidase [Affinibrenneria salicis]
MRSLITLFILIFSQLLFNLAQAATHSAADAPRKASVIAQKADDRKKNKQTKSVKKTSPPRQVTRPGAAKVIKIPKAAAKTVSKSPRQVPPRKLVKTAPGRLRSNTAPGRRLVVNLKNNKINKLKPTHPPVGRRGQRGHEAILTLSEAHKQRYQRARLTAMNKLMNQIGKPYVWGGASPSTGFDCSGLVYYAYKDIVKIPIPRTANEMYHLHDAAPIKRSELESGDLVFFRINQRGAADHVGVYLGNGKFIQSPRTGSEIRISKLSEDYWQDHYVGARRVVTPQTIR